jgi:hypothetical protein
VNILKMLIERFGFFEIPTAIHKKYRAKATLPSVTNEEDRP